MSSRRIIVVGGGAAGTMAAGQAVAEGIEVILLEKMNKIAKKIAISGKGRCNLTNANDVEDFIKYYPGNGKFLYSSLKEFSNIDLISFFKNYNVETKIERGGRVFPVADDSQVIVTALEKFLAEKNVKIFLNQSVNEVLIDDNKHVRGVKLKNSSNVFLADAVIIATGGASYPGTGSTGDGYFIAKKIGHSIITPVPSLVPLKTFEQWPKELKGLTLRNVEVSLWVDGKEKMKEFGEMLFTHFGVSGPIVLTLSRFASQALRKEQRVMIKINLKPALSSEQLDQRLKRDFQKYINKLFRNSLIDLLPKSIIPVIVRLSGIAPDKAVNEITKEERKKLCLLLQNLTLNITDTVGLENAIVTSGGVNVKEINPTTMESRLIKGLFWAGEVIDVDGVTGGYNLQAAFSTGYKAGKHAAKYVLEKYF